MLLSTMFFMNRRYIFFLLSVSSWYSYLSTSLNTWTSNFTYKYFPEVYRKFVFYKKRFLKLNWNLLPKFDFLFVKFLKFNLREQISINGTDYMHFWSWFIFFFYLKRSFLFFFQKLIVAVTYSLIVNIHPFFQLRLRHFLLRELQLI